MRSSAAEAQMQLIKRRLLSGGAWAFGGRVMLAFIGLATNALLARLLTPAELGAYFLAYSIVGICAGLGALGLTKAVVRFVAESVGLGQYNRVRRSIKLAVSFGALGAVVVGVAYLLFGGRLASSLFDSPALAAVTGVTAGWIVVSVVQGILVETFRGFHHIRMTITLGGLANGNGVLTGGLLSTLLLLLWISRGETGLTTVILLAVLSGSVSTLLAGLLLRRKVISLPLSSSHDKLRPAEVMYVAWPLMVTNLAMIAVAQADLWIVGAFLVPDNVAVYGAAARLMLFVFVPLQLINMIVPPLIAEMHAQRRTRELEKTLRGLATVGGIPAFLVLAVFVLGGGPVLDLVFGNYYREGALILAILSLGKLVQVWSGACEQTLMMTGNQLAMMLLTLFGGVFIALGSLWAVQSHGMVGVAVAAALGLGTQNILMVLFARYKVGIWTHVSFLKFLSAEPRT